MSKVINQDIIDKIAEYAAKGYSKAATARELGIDRATVRKYSPEGKVSKEEKDKQPGPQLSVEEEFNIIKKKEQATHSLDHLLHELKGYRWETEVLESSGKAAAAGIEFLRDKLDKAESIAEGEEVCTLVNKVKNDVAALWDENELLRKQRREQEVKEEVSLTQDCLDKLAWVFPCRREQVEKLLSRLVDNANLYFNGVDSLRYVRDLLIDAEYLEWEEDTRYLKPLITECANLLKSNWEDKERIIGILYERKKRILIPSDEDMEKKYFRMIDLLTGEVNEHSVEMVFKFNAALGRLAEERYVDREELLSKETPEAVIG